MKPGGLSVNWCKVQFVSIFQTWIPFCPPHPPPPSPHTLSYSPVKKYFSFWAATSSQRLAFLVLPSSLTKVCLCKYTWVRNSCPLTSLLPPLYDSNIYVSTYSLNKKVFFMLSIFSPAQHGYPSMTSFQPLGALLNPLSHLAAVPTLFCWPSSFDSLMHTCRVAAQEFSFYVKYRK